MDDRCGRMARGLAVAVVAAALFTPLTVEAQDVPAELIRSWQVQVIAGAEVDPAIKTWLEFEEAGTVDGSGGCNSVFGPFSLDNGFQIGPLAVTRKACAPEVLDQERAMLKAISAVRDFRLEEGNQVLLLLNAAGEPVARLNTAN